jgi:chromosome partitioning protein
METIVFAATKGGTGKTTLALNVAVQASKTGTVYVADLDPQQSLTRLAGYRSRQPDLYGLQPMLLTDVRDVAGAVRNLEKSQYARDYLIVDTPGSFVDEIIKPAVRAADCVVLPVQPSPLDVDSQEDMVPIVQELDKSAVSMFVVNRADRNVKIDDTLARVGKLFPNPPVIIKQRVHYVRGTAAGKAGFEMDDDCSSEIADLWDAITKILRKA